MGIKIGYACLTLGVPDTVMKTCRQDKAGEERLIELIGSNLASLERIIDYNIGMGIQMFRISSDLIPFGSSPVNSLPWWEIFADDFQRIGKKIAGASMRVSMHPGQYTVLNSEDQGVVERAVLDLEYHNRVLDCLVTGKEHKIILHVGGVYGDRKEAKKRFARTASSLDPSILSRLVIENDDRSYPIDQVMDLAGQVGVPVVFDNLHHQVLPPSRERKELEWIALAGETWKSRDGVQKIHYSQQDPGKRPGSHSSTINLDDFSTFFYGLEGLKPDIMLEVKDKNLSAVKCINGIRNPGDIKKLEEEWSRYKYSLLESSPLGYQSIRNLLKDKSAYPVLDFYRILDGGLKEVITVGNSINALLHVWGYFKQKASDREKKRFLAMMEKLEKEGGSPTSIKRFLYRLALDYDQDYLKNSYFLLIP